MMKMRVRQTHDGFLFFNEILFLFFKRYFHKKFVKDPDSRVGSMQVVKSELMTMQKIEQIQKNVNYL